MALLFLNISYFTPVFVPFIDDTLSLPSPTTPPTSSRMDKYINFCDFAFPLPLKIKEVARAPVHIIHINSCMVANNLCINKHLYRKSILRFSQVWFCSSYTHIFALYLSSFKTKISIIFRCIPIQLVGRYMHTITRRENR